MKGGFLIKCELFLYYQVKEKSGSFRPRGRVKRAPRLRNVLIGVVAAVAAAVRVFQAPEGYTQKIIERASVLTFRAARRPQRAATFFCSR